MQDIFINEMMVIPARFRDGSYKMEDLVPGYRFEYLVAPEDLPQVATTPKEVVFEEGHVRLFRYKSQTPSQHKPPLLMIYALINRSYILDLRPGNSVIEFLLKNGHDVYLIDWGEPLEEDRFLDMAFYIEHYIDSCVNRALELSQSKKLNLFGWCIGGSLALIYASLHNEKINSLITLTTPGDITHGGMLPLWSNKEYFDIDKIIDVFGNIPGKFIRYGVIEIYPNKEALKNSIFYENLNNPQFLQLYLLVEKWMNDNVDFPGKVFKEYIESVFQDNNLLHGKVQINGKKVSLKNIKSPYLNMAAQLDHLVPIECSKVLNDYVGAEENVFEMIPGGHIGLAFEPMAQQVGWIKLLNWLNKHSQASEKKNQPPKA